MELTKFEQKLNNAISWLAQELSSLHTNRATPALVENISVEYYGASTPLKSLAAISSPGPGEILIQPWDKNSIPVIEQAIIASPLGLAPSVDKEVIRLKIPPMTEERKKELLKLVGRNIEDARIALRRERDEIIKKLETEKKQGEISEDEFFRLKKEVQKKVDDANEKIEQMNRDKTAEIMKN